MFTCLRISVLMTSQKLLNLSYYIHHIPAFPTPLPTFAKAVFGLRSQRMNGKPINFKKSIIVR